MNNSKRYILNKTALAYLGVETKPATTELAKAVIITDEAFHFKHIPYISVVLSNEQVLFLRNEGFEVNEESREGVVFGADYEKVRSKYYKKAPNKSLTGVGTKIAIMDTGCVVAHCPVDFAENFADANPGVSGQAHGHMVTSIVKSAIGLANGAEVHFLKVITSDGDFFESAFLAGIDYCIDNNIDIINMSFSFSSTAFDAAVAAFIATGGIVVAATGNATTDSSMPSPAKLDNVVAINIMDENGDVYAKSVINTGGHGVTAACSGLGCEVVYTNGIIGTTNGTSFSTAFFVGVFACYKEELGISDNYKVLEFILAKCIKTTQPEYFGNGMVTF